MRSRLFVLVAASMVSASAITGCASTDRGDAVPSELQDAAVVRGFGPGIRTWGGMMNEDFTAALKKSVEREREALGLAPGTVQMPPADFLAISGGGSDGAFGAGLVCGWSAAGNRPEFKIVTGISTGALMAPFVYLGPKYDEALRTLYTQTTTKDILRMRGTLAALFEDAMADTKPLKTLLARVIDDKMVADIVTEHKKGRLLLIGTTNLDARRAVLWNIGEIAESGDPKAKALICDVLIASASIPAAFPPIFIGVEAGGEEYQEMHVDGGAATQVFLYPPTMKLAKEAKAAGVVRQRRAYIIRNSKLDPNWVQVDRRVMPIAGRAISSLIASHGVGDLYRIYLNAQRDKVDFNLAYIPPTFTAEAKEDFDKEYMGQLFQVGYDLAKQGYSWQKTPPLYESGSDTGLEP